MIKKIKKKYQTMCIEMIQDTKYPSIIEVYKDSKFIGLFCMSNLPKIMESLKEVKK
jgi:hypothetical protein